MFSARTTQSGKLKALFEVLFSNTQDVILTISKVGIETELTTINNSIICVGLPAEGFDSYEYSYDEPMYVGLGSHVNNFFKSMKNKTPVTLSITHPYKLDVKIQCDEDCSLDYSVSFVCAQNISLSQTYDYDLSKCFMIPTTMFNSMCKSFSKTDNINILKNSGQLMFSSELSGISSKVLTVGQKDTTQKPYSKKFKSDSFVRIGKLSSFASKPIKIHVEVDKPLMILAESTLGIVKVTMSNDDIEF